MSKVKLYGMNRGDKRVHFIIDKKQDFVPMIRNIMKEFPGYTEDSIFLYIPGPNEEGDVRDEKIDDYTDTCVHRKYGDVDMEIFVGKQRIILVIRSSQEIQQKIVDMILEQCEWIK